MTLRNLISQRIFLFFPLTLFYLSMCSGAEVSWTVDSEMRDPLDGRLVKAVTTLNSDNYSATIFKKSEKTIILVLAFPKTSFDRFPKIGNIVALRADSKSSVIWDTGGILELVWTNGLVARITVGFLDDKGAAPLVGIFRDILDGKVLYARFFTETSKAIDTRFDLDGAAELVGKTLDIEVHADPAAVKEEENLNKLVGAAMQRCSSQSSKFLECSQATVECVKQSMSTTKKESALRQCLVEKGWPLD